MLAAALQVETLQPSQRNVLLIKSLGQFVGKTQSEPLTERQPDGNSKDGSV
jgi:hypothetical protein